MTVYGPRWRPLLLLNLHLIHMLMTCLMIVSDTYAMFVVVYTRRAGHIER